MQRWSFHTDIRKKYTLILLHPQHRICKHLSPTIQAGATECWEEGYMLERLPVYHKLTKRDRESFTLTLTPKANLESQINLTWPNASWSNYTGTRSTRKTGRLQSTRSIKAKSCLLPGHNPAKLWCQNFAVLVTKKNYTPNYNRIKLYDTTISFQPVVFCFLFIPALPSFYVNKPNTKNFSFLWYLHRSI